MEKLLEKADLFLTSFRPAALAKLSLDRENVHRRYGRLCQVAIMSYPSPDGIFGGTLPEYRFYETGNGWIAVAALEEHFRTRLMEKLDPRGPGLTIEGCGKIFLTKTAQEWEAWAASLDLPIVAVR